MSSIPNDFADFFKTATAANHSPYDWQRRLAGDEPEAEAGVCTGKGTPCDSRLINIPTGLGKTAGAVLAWLWNRLNLDREDWPRRLVYCLPMRTLVEQTRDEASKWVENLAAAGLVDRKPRVIVLMGGEALDGDDKDWDIHPEEPAVIIGTQDMLLSRALNRGYGMSRYRWPMHFALLNNDALWVMDEVQLMGPGLASTTQLEGFRNAATELGSRGCHSWWMSATIRPDWLRTVDMPHDLLTTKPMRLSNTEKQDGGRVATLRTASKAITVAAAKSGSKNLKAVAEYIDKQRTDAGLNLVVVNTVKRARELHGELRKLLKGKAVELLLLHSQFRPDDREGVLKAIKQDSAGKIVVSTQVIEAGVDLSAHTLFTELAPWSSLVQRFGRCNRWIIDGRQHFTDARIYWFDLPGDKDHPPYKTAALNAARARLGRLEANSKNAALEYLETIDSPEQDQPEFRHVIRRKDLVDLFDTTPDLAGADLDIDRFIRDAEDSHVQVFWRDWQDGPGRAPNGNGDSDPEQAPRRQELCSVSLGDFRDFVKNHGPAYRWSHLDREWQKISASDNLYPGQVYLLHVSQGGYDQGTDESLPTGWNANPKSTVCPVQSEKSSQYEAYDTDPASTQDKWQSIPQHTDHVCEALEHLLAALMDALTDADVTALRHAARWHDWGKAHPAFQAKLEADALSNAPLAGPAAKAPENVWRKGRIPIKPSDGDERRPHFRHELASALGVLLPASGFPLTTNEADNPARDLAAYLIAAHHGKVRLSIRSMPDEWQPTPTTDQPERRFARGVWDGDPLPGVDLGANTTAEAVTLSLEPMELGLGEREPFADQPSWAERCLSLRDTHGPFKLAFLETLLRAADARASAHPSQTND